jgi:hypothetical protein
LNGKSRRCNSVLPYEKTDEKTDEKTAYMQFERPVMVELNLNCAL